MDLLSEGSRVHKYVCCDYCRVTCRTVFCYLMYYVSSDQGLYICRGSRSSSTEPPCCEAAKLQWPRTDKPLESVFHVLAFLQVAVYIQKESPEGQLSRTKEDRRRKNTSLCFLVPTNKFGELFEKWRVIVII